MDMVFLDHAPQEKLHVAQGIVHAEAVLLHGQIHSLHSSPALIALVGMQDELPASAHKGLSIEAPGHAWIELLAQQRSMHRRVRLS